MAKTKSTKPRKLQSAYRSDAKAPESDGVHSAMAAKESARVAGVMSSVEIGHVAGDVWGVLSRNGALTLAALKKEVDAPADLVVAAIGWLAREDKLEFSTTGRSVKVSLR
jgi:hypothetical protein